MKTSRGDDKPQCGFVKTTKDARGRIVTRAHCVYAQGHIGDHHAFVETEDEVDQATSSPWHECRCSCGART